MGTWQDYINEMALKWVGKTVWYKDRTYKVVRVDANGALHLDRPTKYNDTTAVDETMVKVAR